MFVCLNPPTKTSTLAVVADEGPDYETIHCPKFPGHQRPGARQSALHVRVPGPAGDIVWTWQSDCLFSERLIEIARLAGLSGATFRPAHVTDKRGEPLAQRYEELVVTGWGGIAPEESGVQLKERCSACGLLVYSCFTDPTKLVDERQWDGSDFFIVWPLPGFILLSERAAMILEASRAGPMHIGPLDKLRCIGQITPGRLSYWMPIERARDLGKELDIV